MATVGIKGLVTRQIEDERVNKSSRQARLALLTLAGEVLARVARLAARGLIGWKTALRVSTDGWMADDVGLGSMFVSDPRVTWSPTTHVTPTMSLSTPPCLSVCLSHSCCCLLVRALQATLILSWRIYVCACVSATMIPNISETKRFRGSCQMETHMNSWRHRRRHVTLWRHNRDVTIFRVVAFTLCVDHLSTH